MLTKPLGTGIINTAIKGGLASNDATEKVTRMMAALNRDVAETMAPFPVHACTDITGFGLLGHLAEMVEGSGCGIELEADTIPVMPEAVEYAGMGLVPAGAHNNRKFFSPIVDIPVSLDPVKQDIFFDPQTSGGLLICVNRESADDLLRKLRERGIDDAAIIGNVVNEPKEKIVVR